MLGLKGGSLPIPPGYGLFHRLTTTDTPAHFTANVQVLTQYPAKHSRCIIHIVHYGAVCQVWGVFATLVRCSSLPPPHSTKIALLPRKSDRIIGVNASVSGSYKGYRGYLGLTRNLLRVGFSHFFFVDYQGVTFLTLSTARTDPIFAMVISPKNVPK